MISNDRKKNFPIPEALHKAEEQLELIASTGNKDLIKGAIYKGKYQKDGKTRYEVRELLKKVYYHKCAYCEIKEYKPEVEHYRPKSDYYWLCYEWTNLLPSCRYCNTEGGKGNYFPVNGSRVEAPDFLPNGKLNKENCKAGNAPLINEHPCLLHPEIDTPEVCFKFFRNGSISGIDPEGRGKCTVKICNLKRVNLKYRRQYLLDQYKASIQDAIVLFFDDKIDESGMNTFLKRIFTRLKLNGNPEKEFSLFAKYCFDNFDKMIVPFFSTPSQKRAISNAFRMYKNGSL